MEAHVSRANNTDKKKKDKIIEIVEQRMRYFTEKEVIPE